MAIRLPEDIKKRLFRFAEKEYGNLPVKRARQENLHLTLNFLGYILDENILNICESVQRVSENMNSFELQFTGAELGPGSEKKKMIWVVGEKNKELSELKHQLDKALGFFVKERKDFVPHITLGRIQKEKWKKIHPEPVAERSLNFSVPVSSVEIFESRFEKGKRVYYILESFSLK
ncbi:MAG: RNA 2',3'-cyclic phosphodiesterase [Candidatus Moranbacteria bacterium]|nr:RNA 2',3'-cyclic phosphodiesterase [Candidatus Moranbacteria bacterium]